MALVVFGGGITRMVGSHSGNTFSQNKGGSYVKRKPKGTQPRTTSQVTRQATITLTAKAYTFALSDADRAAWRTFASTTPVINKLGNTTFLSAQQMYTKLSAPLLAQGITPPNTPPISTSIGTPTSLVIDATSGPGGHVTLNLTATGTSIDESGLAFISPPLNPGRNYVSSQLRQLPAYFTLNTVYDVTELYIGLFGSLPTAGGQRIFARAYVQSTTTGISSVAIQGNSTWG